jgi:23S rRNA pseudouridine1911/1915/1917 synthase
MSRKNSNQIRLHKVVSDKNTEYNNPQIQKNIAALGVYVNGKPELITNRLEWVYGDDDINISHWPQKLYVPYSEIRIAKETSDYYLVYKPCGLPVQPGVGFLNHNLVSYLLQTYPEQRQIMDSEIEGNHKISAGLVHRLDKDTEGLVIVAKSIEAHKKGQDAFRGREVYKEYLAVVEGRLEEVLDIKGWQVRDYRNPIRQKFLLTDTKDEEARNNHSIFTPLAYDKDSNLTLVKAEIKTGRMHQIRLQAQAIGHPLYQDPMYHNKAENVGREEIEKWLVEGFDKDGITQVSDMLEYVKDMFETHKDGCFYLKSNKVEIKELGIV